MRNNTKKEDTGTWTKNKIWCVHNYTRYATEDILAIFNAVEDAILTQLSVRTLKKYGADSVNDFFIDTYTVSDDVPVKEHGPVNEVRIVPPSKLDISPVETLSQTLNKCKGTFVPQKVVSAFILRVSRSYDGGHFHQGYVTQNGGWHSTTVLLEIRERHLKLRFFDRVETKKPVVESGSARITRFAEEKARSLSYSIDSALSRTKHMEKDVRMLNKHLVKIGQEPVVDEEKIEEIKRFLSEAYARVDRKRDCLRQLIRESKK